MSLDQLRSWAKLRHLQVGPIDATAYSFMCWMVEMLGAFLRHKIKHLTLQRVFPPILKVRILSNFFEEISQCDTCQLSNFAQHDID